MTEEVQGKILKITNWKNGKGYFLTLEEIPVDFYGFGTSKVEVGQTVTAIVEHGEGSFSEKYHIKKILETKEPIKQAIEREESKQKLGTTEQKTRPSPTKEEQKSIARSVALKASIERMNHLETIGQVTNGHATIQEVLELAKEFEKYLQGEN